MTRMEVWCCCKPEKLLGWLPVVTGQRSYRRVIVSRQAGPFEEPAIDQTTVELPVARIFHGGESYLALKSEETPIETLRLLPDFVEAGPGDQH